MSAPDRRSIPSVDAILRQLPSIDLPRPLIVAAVRSSLHRLRAGHDQTIPAVDDIVADLADHLAPIARSRIQPVINATGVILHTNLGRSPLGMELADDLYEIATRYSTLEFDLLTGDRGKRGFYVEHALATLCESAAATVVNNCAAALMLIVNVLTAGERKHVIISRGELVQIGGGFRVPDILEASGAKLREVGTTNQTNLDDYRRAIDDDAAMILRVHRSNFFMDGFVSSPTIGELSSIAREAGVPLVDDIGSGAIFDTSTLRSNNARSRSGPDPTPASSLAAGADLVCFSGDKLLGGPQAGIIAGDAQLVARLKRAPIFRALRCDKLALSALQSTIDEYLNGSAANIPVRTMLELTAESLRHRAEQIIAAIPNAGLIACPSCARVGGGSLPQVELPSIAIQLPTSMGKAQALLSRLRDCRPPLIATIIRDHVHLDLRSVFPDQDHALIAALKWLLNPVAAVR